MKPLLASVLVFITMIFDALGSEPSCPVGTELFLKDKNLPSCGPEASGPNSTNLKPLHLFDIRKSYNPQNVLVIYSEVTAECKFPETQRPQELIDFYWRMREGTDDACKKESAVKEKIRTKIKIQSVSEDRGHMVIYLDDLDKVKHDLPDRAATITLSKAKDTSCNVQVSFATSSVDKNKKLQLQCVYGEPIMLFFGLPSPVEEVESLTLFGTDENNKPVSKRFIR
ncbi:MAG: hypothetical protein A4S09_03225 [Proteobacteria bacterium SG_bin7]|nr:MAG: hypothetical protein A4S09_03225 [Proteobacteria bacterium SG_bin7]